MDLAGELRPAQQLGEAEELRLYQRDVLTKTNNLGDFESGKAAMMIDGTWDTQKFTDALGDKVAAFVPPFSTTPIKGVVDYAGDACR
jgi:ABC-type glycerol-3-phosphate transport system substrate-binding protein